MPLTLEQLITLGLQNQTTPEQMRRQGIISGAAGGLDAIFGSIGQRRAEKDIEEFGAEADAIRQQMKDVRAPSIMSPENQAAAVRNAAILGAGKPQEDSSELAAAKMAMESGADPTKIQRALTEAEAQKDERARLEQQGAFREGLGYASQDAMSEYQKQMQDLGMDYDENQRALEMAQQQSLMAQQQKQQGFGNLAGGATKFLSSGGWDKLFGGEEDKTTTDATDAGSGGGFSQILGDDYQFGDLTGGGFGNSVGGLNYAQGGAVQMTPGAFKHDDGDGIYEEGENEMSVMRHMAGGKFQDTGIDLTGGELVINPKQGEGLTKAYERIKKVLARKIDPSRADLEGVADFLSFLDEPQFNNVD